MGLVAGGLLLLAARMICATAVSLWATPATGGVWHDLWHPAVPCPCWSVLHAGVRPHILAIEESPYLDPALIVIVSLALLGFTRAIGPVAAFIRSISYGLLDRWVGLAAGVLLAMIMDDSADRRISPAVEPDSRVRRSVVLTAGNRQAEQASIGENGTGAAPIP